MIPRMQEIRLVSINQHIHPSATITMASNTYIRHEPHPLPLPEKPTLAPSLDITQASRIHNSSSHPHKINTRILTPRIPRMNLGMLCLGKLLRRTGVVPRGRLDGVGVDCEMSHFGNTNTEDTIIWSEVVRRTIRWV